MNAFWCALVVALGLAMGASELNIGDRVSTERATPSMLEQEVKNLENPSSEYMGKFAQISSCESCNCTSGPLPPACCKPSDPGAGARCKSVTTGCPGLLNCLVLVKWPGNDWCPEDTPLPCKGKPVEKLKSWSLHDPDPGRRSNPHVGHACPDGITHMGVWMPTPFAPGFRNASGAKQRDGLGYGECHPWNSGITARNVNSRCSTYGNGTTCVKMSVWKPNLIKPTAGVLVYKRIRCVEKKIGTAKVKSCSVFKAGLCIDVGYDAWGWSYNSKIKDMPFCASDFAAHAIKILNDTRFAKGLPKTHSEGCSGFDRGWRDGDRDGDRKDLPTAERLVRDYIMTY